MKIVVDAMGGDHAPGNIIEGVIAALREYKVTIVLVGQQDRIIRELQKFQYPKDLIEIVHAPEVVEMDDHAAVALRQKKNSSITIGVGLLKDPQYSAFISAGNTGAVVAASTIVLVISSLILVRISCSTSRIAARIACLMAFGDERPWLIITKPSTPNSGAPPYSE